MAHGTVKWFNDQKGYGFIKQEGVAEDIFVHHTAIKMEGFRTLTPGEAVDFEIKKDEKVIGNQVNVKVVKNKVAPPFRLCEFDIIYGEGVSKVGEILDLGVECGVVQKSGSWFSYDSNKLGQGRESVKSLLLDNPELAEEIERKVKDKLMAVPALAAPTE